MYLRSFREEILFSIGKQYSSEVKIAALSVDSNLIIEDLTTEERNKLLRENTDRSINEVLKIKFRKRIAYDKKMKWEALGGLFLFTLFIFGCIFKFFDAPLWLSQSCIWAHYLQYYVGYKKIYR